LLETPTRNRVPVPPEEAQITSLGVHALDSRRVDVAVDITICTAPLNVEMVIVGPDDDELCSIALIDNREPELDKVMHIRQDALPGEHVLHVGLFYEGILVARAARGFRFPAAASEPVR
jgi:hypothetical protein